MCQVFASHPPENYASETRSIRLNGQSTSIRLEKAFWDILAVIAERQGFASVPKFISTLHSEVLALHGEALNFTSHLRCVCLLALEQGLSRPAPETAPGTAPDALSERPAAAA